MGKFFGTDGIRGQFNQVLTIELALRVGVAAGQVFSQIDESATVCIAMDPRDSSKAIENALVAGLISEGVDVELFGVTTTPVISYKIIKEQKYCAGIMISASHNPYYDNGIKFFGSNGKKLSDELEAKIEEYLDNPAPKRAITCGKVTTDSLAVRQYIDYLKSFSVNLEGLNVGLDCSNGSTIEAAKTLFTELGANIVTIGDQANGININDNIGSTHPEKLAQLVVEHKLDVGFAFDGDGDRIILINKEGDILDGDYIIYLIARELKREGKLNNNMVITTVMANIGFKLALDKLDINYLETQVGDRYVMQAIEKEQASVGGEQSGHIIIPDLLPTGDGILTAVYLAKIFKQQVNALPLLKEDLQKYPQVLINVKVQDKDAILNSTNFIKLIKEQEQQLAGSGRILVRASGTEQLVRVMAEAKTIDICQDIVKPIVYAIEKNNI